MSAWKVVLVGLALGVVGCGSVRTYRWPLAAPGNPAVRPAVYFEGTMPQTSMLEVELVESIGYGTKAEVPDVVSGLQDEAQRWGADAIVRVRVDCGHGSCHGYGVAVRWVTSPPPQGP